MDHTEPVILIDSDMRRRASISHAFAGSAYHVEPFESVSEVERAWPRSGIVLACDEGTRIARLIALMGRNGDWLPLVAFAEAIDPARIVDAVLAGALGYLRWPFGTSDLGDALSCAAARAENLGNVRLREAMARSRVDKLTRREREVLVGVASGLSNRLIGEKLSISPRTVEIHRANMLNKMGATHSSEAIRIAIEAAIVD